MLRIQKVVTSMPASTQKTGGEPDSTKANPSIFASPDYLSERPSMGNAFLEGEEYR
jgi:hypothetical protein